MIYALFCDNIHRRRHLETVLFMERKYRYLTIAGGLALSLATITSACGREKTQSKNTYPTPNSTSASCFDQSLSTREALQNKSKSITENRLNETIEFMKCSSIDPLIQFADKLKQLQRDGHLVLDDFSRPNGVAAGDIASLTFYGGFPTLDDSSYRMTVDLNKNGMSYADFAIFLYKETLVMTTLNDQIKKTPNMATKIASNELNRASIECLAWVNTIKDVGIPLKGKVEVGKIKSSIEAYERQYQEDIIDCINSADLN